MKIKLLLLLALNLSVNNLTKKSIYENVKVGEEILIPSTKEIISGSLLLPEAENSNSPSPVFIIISGSGDFSYRSHFKEGADYTLFKDISTTFLEHGSGVFLLEKRGINRSSGNWQKAGFLEYALDVRKVMDYLLQRPEIDPSRISLLGHSQGGYIAQMVASLFPDDVFSVINLAGPAQPVFDQVMSDMEKRYDCNENSALGKTYRKAVLYSGLSLMKFSSWMIKPTFLSHVISHDPSGYISNIACPMLSIYAENDYRVDYYKNMLLMDQYIERDPMKHTAYFLPDTNHYFFNSEMCFDWDKADKTANPSLLWLIGDWLVHISKSKI